MTDPDFFGSGSVNIFIFYLIETCDEILRCKRIVWFVKYCTVCTVLYYLCLVHTNQKQISECRFASALALKIYEMGNEGLS